MGTRTGLRATVATAVLALAIVATAVPASASPLMVAVEGTATFSGGTFGSGCLTGTAAGSHTGPVAGPMSADFSYNGGTAAGTMNLPLHSANFTWVRVGQVAVVTFSSPGHTGAGVMVFGPIAVSVTVPPCALGRNETFAGAILLI